ncbi:hypothetical protein F8388_015284, partial [Cannabis sativa]
NQVLLATAESRLAEARKQYNVMLESKLLERHLKELSQRNDQAINRNMRREVRNYQHGKGKGKPVS